jgi:polyhydroxyalkanoate synthesis regulator phasin
VAGVSAGTGIWLIISGIIALFCGGWVAGRLSGEPSSLDRAINGIVLWGLVVAASLWLTAATASAVVGGALGVVRTSAMAVVRAAGAAAPAVGQAFGTQQQQQVLSDIQNRIQQIVSAAADTTPEARQQLQQDLRNVVDELANQGQLSSQTRQNLSQILVRYADMSQQQADSLVNSWEQAYQRAASQVQQQAEPVRQAAEQAAQQAADAAAAAAGWAFFVLLLDAIAALVGGVVASPRNGR